MFILSQELELLSYSTSKQVIPDWFQCFEQFIILLMKDILHYIWDVWSPVNNGINYQSPNKKQSYKLPSLKLTYPLKMGLSKKESFPPTTIFQRLTIPTQDFNLFTWCGPSTPFPQPQPFSLPEPSKPVARQETTLSQSQEWWSSPYLRPSEQGENGTKASLIQGKTNGYPPVNKHSNGKPPSLIGDTSSNGGFPIAKLS